MTTLVTGSAGFIGSFVCRSLLQQQHSVIGIDNLNSAYDVQLKLDRLSQIDTKNFKFIHQDICNQTALDLLFEENPIDCVIHLAAEAGQEQTENHAERIMHNNIVGFNCVLEACRKHAVKQVVYASSAAVYGDNSDYPVTEKSNTDQPLSLYAASKKSNEIIAHSYATLYAMHVTGLRFFTVYGPWGRPDMALYKFTRNILAGLPLNIHNNGQHSRDLIYVDDLVEAINLVLNQKLKPDSQGTHQIYNLGHETAVDLMTMVNALEQHLNQHTEHNFLPKQAGEIQYNQADAGLFRQTYGWQAKVNFNEGLEKFVSWYREYHSV